MGMNSAPFSNLFFFSVAAILFVIFYRNKSKENHSYNVRVETARVFQRNGGGSGSKSQLAAGSGSGCGDGGSGSQSIDTDSCHRRSMEGSVEEKYDASWVFGPASGGHGHHTPPVSSSTKSSRCSSANTNRNSLLNVSGYSSYRHKFQHCPVEV